MADMFSMAKRSQIMRAVTSTNNEATERRVVTIFRRYGIKGWRRHLPLPGRPDFTFRRQRVTVFVDGCFWHGCAKHLRMPENNRGYWEEKISRNVIRDKRTTIKLRKAGWKVLRVWEHELRREAILLKRITKVLAE